MLVNTSFMAFPSRLSAVRATRSGSFVRSRSAHHGFVRDRKVSAAAKRCDLGYDRQPHLQGSVVHFDSVASSEHTSSSDIAQRKLGLHTVPCLVHEVDDDRMKDMQEAAMQRPTAPPAASEP